MLHMGVTFGRIQTKGRMDNFSGECQMHSPTEKSAPVELQFISTQPADDGSVQVRKRHSSLF